MNGFHRLHIKLCAVVGIYLLSCAFVSKVLGTDRMRAPKAVIQSKKEVMRRSPQGGAMRGLVRFFRTTISKVDGNRCAMYPTCSHYGEKAMAKHGAALGLLLFVDRLFHEWSETTMAPKIRVHGVMRYWDPLGENDFWFAEKKKE